MTTTDDNGADNFDALKLQVMTRLRAEGRWIDAMPTRDRLMRESRDLGLNKRDAQETAYRQLDALYPPMTAAQIEAAKRDADEKRAAADAKLAAELAALDDKELIEELREEDVGGVANLPPLNAEPVAIIEPPARARDGEAAVVGLGEIPAHWPVLAANASLSAEISWVQANRLHCVQDRGEQTVVDLSKALAPAPSWAALGWLETSIRAYSKYVDVAAKASASMDDANEQVKRERLGIDEIRSLLSEMAVVVSRG
jgi:hypothetical protein